MLSSIIFCNPVRTRSRLALRSSSVDGIRHLFLSHFMISALLAGLLAGLGLVGFFAALPIVRTLGFIRPPPLAIDLISEECI